MAAVNKVNIKRRISIARPPRDKPVVPVRFI
jgi:hypothetical protein